MQNYSSLISEWKFVRQLSLDLLDSLAPDDLGFSPPLGDRGPGELWRQFRHIGRVQEDYIDALRTGSVSFTTANKSFPETEDPTRPEALRRYLNRLDEELFQEVERFLEGEQMSIDWFGDRAGVEEHLVRLISHETLHHGQWIIYLRALGRKFPESWRSWGV